MYEGSHWKNSKEIIKHLISQKRNDGSPIYNISVLAIEDVADQLPVAENLKIYKKPLRDKRITTEEF